MISTRMAINAQIHQMCNEDKLGSTYIQLNIMVHGIDARMIGITDSRMNDTVTDTELKLAGIRYINQIKKCCYNSGRFKHRYVKNK